MNNPRKKLATLFIFLDFRGGKLAESVRQEMVRGSGDPPKPGTRKSIGCPVYPISQWYCQFSMQKYEISN